MGTYTERKAKQHSNPKENEATALGTTIVYNRKVDKDRFSPTAANKRSGNGNRNRRPAL